MAVDKQAVLEAQRRYREMNEADLIQQMKTAERRTPEQKWREFEDLFAFGSAVRPDPRGWERVKEAQELETYCERIRRFEERRQLARR